MSDAAAPPGYPEELHGDDPAAAGPRHRHAAAVASGAAAVARGITTFTASLLAENRLMLGLLDVLDEEVHTALSGGEYTVTLRLADPRLQPAMPRVQDDPGRS